VGFGFMSAEASAKAVSRTYMYLCRQPRSEAIEMNVELVVRSIQCLQAFAQARVPADLAGHPRRVCRR